MGKGIEPTSTSVILTILFAVMIIYFVVSFVTLKNPGSQVLTYGNGTFSKASTILNSTINDINSDSERMRQLMDESEPSPVSFVFLIFEGAFLIPKLLYSLVFGSAVALFNVIFSFGLGWGLVIVTPLTVGLVILLMRIIVYTIKFIRGGEPG
jgi:hypothetical protein